MLSRTRKTTRKTTTEEITFIMRNWDKHTRAELVDMLNAKFTDVKRNTHFLHATVSLMQKNGIKLSPKTRESKYVQALRNTKKSIYELALEEVAQDNKEDKLIENTDSSVGARVTKFYGKVFK